MGVQGGMGKGPSGVGDIGRLLTEVLVHLLGSVDPNTDVLSDMQTRRVEKLVFLAGAIDRR